VENRRSIKKRSAIKKEQRDVHILVHFWSFCDRQKRRRRVSLKGKRPGVRRAQSPLPKIGRKGPFLVPFFFIPYSICRTGFRQKNPFFGGTFWGGILNLVPVWQFNLKSTKTNQKSHGTIFPSRIRREKPEKKRYEQDFKCFVFFGSFFLVVNRPKNALFWVIFFGGVSGWFSEELLGGSGALNRRQFFHSSLGSWGPNRPKNGQNFGKIKIS